MVMTSGKHADCDGVSGIVMMSGSGRGLQWQQMVTIVKVYSLTCRLWRKGTDEATIR